MMTNARANIKEIINVNINKDENGELPYPAFPDNDNATMGGTSSATI